jgi:group I intron endonuclease
MYYAYLITNNVNQKVYVGITKDPVNRWQRHQSNARSSSDKPRYHTYLYNAMRKHGVGNFSCETVATFSSKEECELYEIAKIDYMRTNNVPHYNLHDGGTLGYNMQNSTQYEKWKKKLSLNAIANSSDTTARDAWISKLKEQRKGRTPALGMKHTDETKQLASEVSNTYWDTQETFTRDASKVTEILKLSHKEAKKQYGISTTHYYRLKKRFTTNDSE